MTPETLEQYLNVIGHWIWTGVIGVILLLVSLAIIGVFDRD